MRLVLHFKKSEVLADFGFFLYITMQILPRMLHILFRLNLLTIFLFISVCAKAQIKGIVVEKGTQVPIAFVSVTYGNKMSLKGTITDVNGRFQIEDIEIKDLTFSCVGYKSEQISLNHFSDKNFIIELTKDMVAIGEVVISASQNPAIPIIKKVLRNKHINNFEDYPSFRYNCYFKTIGDVKLSKKTDNGDSAHFTQNKDLKNHALLISEMGVRCTKQDAKTENRIFASQMSGFSGTLIPQSFFMLFHHAISFYNNDITLFKMKLDDKVEYNYLSPLADDCLSAYNYHLDDAYFDGKDSIFVITYFPKKNKNFNGLRGKLYVCSNRYSLKNVLAQPNAEGLIYFKFRQDYTFVAGHWFPSKLYEEVGFSDFAKSNKYAIYPVYIITSVTDSVNFNPVTDKINIENVYIDKQCLKNSSAILDSIRPLELTIREKNTYQILDSIGRKEHIEQKLNLVYSLLTGYLPIGVFDLSISNLYSYNKHEGSRIGLGLYTNDNLSRYFSIGGYTAYGVKDEKLKYGGNFDLIFSKYYDVKLRFSYRNDLKETGQEQFYQSTLNSYLRGYVISQLDLLKEKAVLFNFRLSQPLYILTGVSLRKLHPSYFYQYQGITVNNYTADEFYFGLHYGHKEEITEFLGRRITTYNGNPVLDFTFRRGLNTFDRGSYLYSKIEASIGFNVYKGRIGQSNVCFNGGYIDRSVPYGLLFTGEGSKNSDVPFAIENSFQTMKAYEFLSDRYLNLFYSHNFGHLLFESKYFKPQFELSQNCSWGSLKHPEYHQGITFNQKDKVYLEAGLMIKDIVRFSYLHFAHIGVGAGTFYRYGHYHNPQQSDNVAIKASITISFR
jgi:hypothetical protein